MSANLQKLGNETRLTESSRGFRAKEERSNQQEGWEKMPSDHVQVGSTATESLVGELSVSMVNACLVKTLKSDLYLSTLLTKIRSAHI